MEHALSYEKASKIWVPHPNDLWILCDIISVDEQQGTAVVKSLNLSNGEENQKEQVINLSLTQHYHPSHTHELDNLCSMNNFHEAPLLHSLKQRYLKNKIYTSIGDVLISVNPYSDIPGLYSNGLEYFLSNQDDALGKLTPLPPHVFQIAKNALQFMLSDENLTNDTNQSIIISGESGAGKTEASKKVIQFLIDIDNYLRHQDSLSLLSPSSPSSPSPSIAESSTTKQNEHPSQETLGAKINRQIWESTYIFESFGNAKTIRNDNSSRFGKFIKLKYGSNNRLITANAETFLLEKSRLNSIALGERNYHIFYQLFHGHHESLDLKELNLTTIENYQMLLSDISMNSNQKHVIHGTYPTYPTPDVDSQEFSHLCQALRTFGCSTIEMKSIWLLLSTLLHLGNCYCVTPEMETNTSSSASSRDEPIVIRSHSLSIEDIATNLGVNIPLLKRTLTVRVIQAMNRKSFTSKCLTIEEAEYNIKALIKHLYGHLFQWLQSTINKSFEENQNLHGSELDQITLHRYIGILDIFGFEIFQENSFEQLCINFANELLQKLFNDTLFRVEQEEYAREGIEWQQLDYADNQNVIDLISKKPHGLFHVLDAQCMLNRKTDDAALLSTFSKYHLMKPSANSPPPLFDIPKFHKNERFLIRHFAGEVEYSIQGFLSKNNISLQEDVQEVLKHSTSQFIRKILSVVDEEDEALIEQLNEDNEIDDVGQNTLHNERLLSSSSDLNNEGERKSISTDNPAAPPLPPPPASSSSSNKSATTATAPPEGESTASSSSSSSHPLLRLTGGSKRFAGQVTVSSHFREQLNDLLSSLETTRTHYIKCIKPNEDKRVTDFNSKLIMQQLQCNGIMELVRIKRQGYPTHSEFINFYHVFSILGHHQHWKPPTSCTSEECKEYCQQICQQCLPTNMFQIGIHKIFLRDGFDTYLREEKLKILNNEATHIQAHLKRYLQQRNYQKILLQILQIQKWYRCKYYSRLFHKKLHTILLIQSLIRMKIQTKQYQIKRNYLIKIQGIGRKYVEQRRYQRVLRSVQRIIQQVRITLARREFKRRQLAHQRHIAMIVIQKRIRGWLAKRLLKKLQRLEMERIAAEEEKERRRQQEEFEEKERQRQLMEEEAERERIAALEAEKLERERIAAEEAERERIAAEEAEKERVRAEEAERIRIATLEAEKLEKERIAAEEAERERIKAEEAMRRRSLLNQHARESRKLIDERIEFLKQFRAATLIQVFFRMKCRRVRRPTIVSMKLTQPTFKELVVETYCQHFIRNLKRNVNKK